MNDYKNQTKTLIFKINLKFFDLFVDKSKIFCYTNNVATINVSWHSNPTHHNTLFCL